MQWFHADKPVAQFVFAHGAGAGMDSEFMQEVAKLIAKQGVSVALFDFPYMQKAKAENKRRPPDRADKLLAHFEEVIAQTEKALPLFIGGKSMGGRMASMLVAKATGLESVRGVIAFGYPFHPPGKKDTLRVDHFADITVPFCVIQGQRDTFGKQDELSTLADTRPAVIHWINDGDHSLVPRKKSGYTQAQNWQQAADIAVAFIEEQL
ncbi:alpha/beta family hydrolase [Pseudoalteromonas sp. SSDWG2]|uniref:alpha/beta family hydrolase n=1 Tax=Pseudoalteromonas sp. SSDWG2 TaxID=3139391 RepID=UPI003BA84BF1